MAAQGNPHRRQDLEDALKRAKPRDRLTLEQVSLLWGVTKQRFVTVKNAMAAFPGVADTVGNLHYFPARAAIKAMLAHEKRFDQMASDRAARADAILGKSRGLAGAGSTFSPTELATMSRLAAEIEERERAQGEYVPVAEVAAIAGEVFSIISDFCSRLSNEIDPHGRLPPDTRRLIDEGSHRSLLQCHTELKDMLSPDAKRRDPRATGNRARKSRARR